MQLHGITTNPLLFYVCYQCNRWKSNERLYIVNINY